MQAYYGIRMYNEKDELVVNEEFSASETNEAVAHFDAKWEY